MGVVQASSDTDMARAITHPEIIDYIFKKEASLKKKTLTKLKEYGIRDEKVIDKAMNNVRVDNNGSGEIILRGENITAQIPYRAVYENGKRIEETKEQIKNRLFHKAEIRTSSSDYGMLQQYEYILYSIDMQAETMKAYKEICNKILSKIN